MKAGDLLVSSGMGQVYPKNYPVAEVTSVYSDPGQDFATVKARPLAQLASTRHVMLVFASEERVLPEFDLEPGEETLPEEQPVEPVFDESQASQIDPSTSNQ
jgi:rod shape-determining protein MreC